VRGGLLQIDGQVVHANGFVIVEPGAMVAPASPFGALLLAWAEGPEDWVGGAPAPDRTAATSLFGF
jgi:hypothetical protein